MDLKHLEGMPSWEWPRDSDQAFLNILKDPSADASERLLAAEMAGEYATINDHLSGALLAILSSATEPEELRAQAATSLGPALEGGYTFEFDDPDDVPVSEEMFIHIQQSLRQLYGDPQIPKLVRRRIFESAVRAPEDWQKDAITEAYASPDPEWVLTAVFGMRYVRGFDHQILQALDNPDELIHFEAVQAAGRWELESAWSHIAALLNNRNISKDLLLAAIEAAGAIRPKEAQSHLARFLGSHDEDIVDAADEAISMAGGMPDEEDEEDVDEEDEEDAEDGEWLN